MSIFRQTLLIAALALSVGACSSSPTWEGMSQSQIAEWKQAGFDAQSAQAWSKEGFATESAADWSGSGFELEAASDWAGAKFTAAEAQAWRAGGFDLEEAIEDRDKGLQPVAPARSPDTTSND